MSRLIITGATGGAPNRLEINDFVKNEKYFSLFIQALQAMQQEAQNNVPSFFSVGKIHGLPYGPWNDAVGSPPWNPNTTWGGYCTHGSVLFPTWHRPYMMLHEQILQSHAKRIAATYTVNQAAWKQAAADLRHPFWDWALHSVPPDEVIALKQVIITAPNGNKITVNNPLYHYVFHPIDRSFPRPYSQWSATVRHPTRQDSSATDNVARLKSVLQSAQYDITSSTYNMLTRIHDWPAFSNHTVGDGGSTSNSIEAIHDGIHVNVGGGGQMSNPSVAAFDPIFFLHHCNVDRMLQLWSALNPGVWVTRNTSRDGTFTIPASTPVDQNTPLAPFWDGQTTFWISSRTHDTTRLGYTYPDFNGLDMSNPQTVKVAIANRVNELYGSSIFGGLRAVPVPSPVPIPPVNAPNPFPGTISPPFGGIPPVPFPRGIPPIPLPSGVSPIPFPGGMAPIPLPGAISGLPWPGPFLNAFATEPTTSIAASDTSVVRAAKLATPKQSSDTNLPEAGPDHPTIAEDLTPPDQGLFDWTARIEFKKYELNESFAVLLFLGEVPNDPHDWLVSPNYVGSHYAFVNTSASQCSNCVSQADIIVEGFVHLNQAIIKHSASKSLEPSVVEPYLKQNLRWRVFKVPGVVANLSSLEVSVYVTPLSYPPDAIFPVPGERTCRGGITHGREGGCRHASV